MIRDWDLWPIYLDRGWIAAEAAKRIAQIERSFRAVIAAYTVSAAEASAALEQMIHAAHPATRR